jgi:hypothetical protein
VGKSYQAAKRLTDVPHVSWPRLSRPSMSFQAASKKDVGGRPSPAMTRVSQAQRWLVSHAKASAKQALAILSCLVFGSPAWSAAPNDGCQLLPGDQVAAVLGKAVDSATPWPLAGKYACMYESEAIPGVDLLVNLIVAGPGAKQTYEKEIIRLHNRYQVAGIGDEAAWSSERVGTMVADGLDVLSEPYVVEITFLGSPKSPPTGADDLNRARALAMRALSNAGASGL